MPESAIAGSHGSCVSGFMRRCQTVFQRGCPTWGSHWLCVRGPLSLTSSPEFDVVRIFCLSHSDRYVVMSRYGFNLHFFEANDGEHLSTCSLAICISSEMSIHDFCPFSIWIAWWLLLLNFQSLYMFWTLLPCGMCGWQILYPSMWHLFILFK